MQRILPFAAAAAIPIAMLSAVSIAQPGGASIALPDMQPGAYAETSRIVSAGGTVPNELKQAMRSKTAGTTRFCYLPDPAASRRLSIIEVQAGKDCRPVAGTVTGENATIHLACQDAETTGTIVHTGTFRRDTARFRSRVSVDFIKQKRKMTYTAEVTWQRLGDSCDAEAGA